MSRNGSPPPRPCGREGRRLLEQLRVVALHVETAALLERRAAVSDNPVLAVLLAERAACHRQAAARVRGGLTAATTVAGQHR